MLTVDNSQCSISILNNRFRGEKKRLNTKTIAGLQAIDTI
jgi:hypothetical protein